MKEEKNLAKELKDVENKLKRGHDVHTREIRARRNQFHSYNNKVDETLNRVRSLETHLPQSNMEAIASKFKKVGKVDRKLEKNRKEWLKNREDALDEKMQRVKTNKDALEAEARDKKFTLKESIANSGHLVGEVKNAMLEEILQRKEINLLKKKD